MLVPTEEIVDQSAGSSDMPCMRNEFGIQRSVDVTGLKRRTRLTPSAATRSSGALVRDAQRCPHIALISGEHHAQSVVVDGPDGCSGRVGDYQPREHVLGGNPPPVLPSRRLRVFPYLSVRADEGWGITRVAWSGVIQLEARHRRC